VYGRGHESATNSAIPRRSRRQSSSTAGLAKARQSFAEGQISANALGEIEDRAIRDVVALQEDLGLQAATDGEFRRTSWHMDFIYQLGGITSTDENFRSPSRTTRARLFHVGGSEVNDRVRLDKTIFGDAFEFLKSTVTTSVPKLTIPSPSMVHYRRGAAAIDPAVYPDVEEFWSDLSAAYAEEIRRLGELGCTYLQLDDTSLAYLKRSCTTQMIAERGDDAEHQHLRYIRQLNAALATRPPAWRLQRTHAEGTSSPTGRPRAATTLWPRLSSADLM